MLRVGIIGLGDHFFEFLLEALLLNHHVEVVVMCDLSHERLEQASLHIKSAHKVTEWQEVFNYSVDAIICAASPQLHEAVILKSIENNVAVFVEKPPFKSLSSLKNVLDIKQQTSYAKPIGVGINFNYSRMIQMIKDMISEEHVGQITEIAITHLSTKPSDDIWSLDNPKHTMLLAQAIHPLSLIKEFISGIDLASFKYQCLEIGNRALLHAIFESSDPGNRVFCSVRTGSFGPRFQFDISITFESGARIECSPSHINFYTTSGIEMAKSKKWSYLWEDNLFASGVLKGGYYQVVDAFVKASINDVTLTDQTPEFFEDIYQAFDMILSDEETRE